MPDKAFIIRSMLRIIYPFIRLTAHLFCLLIFYFIFRAGFLIFNTSSFQELDFGILCSLFWHGMRFDVSAILVLNSLFIFLFLLPFNPFKFPGWQKLLRAVFMLTNSVALLFEVADWMYFPFNHKRATAGIFNMISRKGDFLEILPSFLKDYWYAFVLAVILLLLLYKSYRSIEQYFNTQYQLWVVVEKKPEIKNRIAAFGIRLLILLLSSGLTVIGIRGGLQYIPINIRNAVEASKSEYAPIVLNTPFSIINSFSNKHLELKHFMEDREAMQLVKPVKQYKQKLPFRKKNVVVIILESFSKEFTKLTPGKSYTPFLDSLMDHSLTFTNAFSNGLHSAEGIPAVIAGIPSLMSEYFTTSVYSTNTITSLPSVLKKQGYTSDFFHGATDGSMSFDVFAKSAGYDHYWGREEYNNEADYDGNWGIFDEPFFQYFARHLDTLSQPFFASIFSVTSHPPYPIPEKYKDRFDNDGLAIHPCIEYTDFALRNFFDSIKDKKWFQNTLFVITPDHCSPLSSTSYYANGTGRYQIPLIFYAPGDTSLKGYNPELVEQIDILPSVLDYLHYDQPFFALGNSVFRANAPRFVSNQLSDVFYWINRGTQMELFKDKPREIYAFPADSLRTHNLLNNPAYKPDAASFKLWQAFVQVYNHALIDNKMTAGRINNTGKK